MKPLPFLQNDFGWVVASFAPNGAQRWAQVFNGPGNSADVARAVVLDPQQGLYVLGVTADAFGRSDWLTIKYSLAGVEQWRQVEAGVGNTDDQPVALKLDSAGNVVVLGYVQPTNVSGPKDLRVVKRDPQGNLLWKFDYSETALSDEFPAGLAIDATGNIYVTGMTVATTSPEQAQFPLTIKLDPNGNQLFRLKGDGKGGDAIAIDAQGISSRRAWRFTRTRRSPWCQRRRSFPRTER
jgi:hypothetical protein